MASSATVPNSLSFLLSSLFQSSSHQIPKTYISVSKFGSGRVSKPLSVASQLATLPIISFEGEKGGETYLDLKTAHEDTARAVVHRSIVTDLQNKPRGTASTLKKTSNARRGSQRIPLRPGGGVVFRPRPKDWSVKINRKEKKLAISTAISSARIRVEHVVREEKTMADYELIPIYCELFVFVWVLLNRRIEKKLTFNGESSIKNEEEGGREFSF